MPMGESPEKIAAASFWSELKRRRVVRVVVLYAIAGWVVIEVASTVLPNLNLPTWTVTLVTALVVLGFFIAATLAWAFDIVPEKSKTSPPENEPEPAGNPAAPVAAETAAPAAASGDRRKSIAVLPFVNMSDDKENEYFSDGMSEEILNLLVKLPQLRVASRTSSFLFKGKEASIPNVARELGVETVLEGSIRRAGGRVRITAQLIDATTDSHLWSETYDREMKDVFAIQDDIAQSIVDALEMTLTPKERRSIQNVATADAGAYDYYLRGRSYMYTMTKRDYEHAIAMYKKAIDLDAKYALAFAGIADAYSHMYRYADGSREIAARALEYSEKAVAMDPDSAEARASRGLALFINEQYPDAEREFERAIELNPNLFEAYYYSGLAYASHGQFERAVAMYRKAAEVNPADPQPVAFLAQAYSSLGRRHEEMKARLASIELMERHLKMNPDDTRTLCIAANQYSNVGEFERGQEMAEEALKRGQDEPLVLYNVACFYTLRGDLDRALDLLSQAVDRGWGDRAWLETDSDLDALRSDKRFTALLERIQ
ncbi:MAG: tetratricopeptide repeat protein [Lysobacterales bacterium]|jgi:adenylate cyclase